MSGRQRLQDIVNDALDDYYEEEEEEDGYGCGYEDATEELRVDPNDGKAYSKAQFEEYYGGSQEWESAKVSSLCFEATKEVANDSDSLIDLDTLLKRRKKEQEELNKNPIRLKNAPVISISPDGREVTDPSQFGEFVSSRLPSSIMGSVVQILRPRDAFLLRRVCKGWRDSVDALGVCVWKSLRWRWILTELGHPQPQQLPEMYIQHLTECYGHMFIRKTKSRSKKTSKEESPKGAVDSLIRHRIMRKEHLGQPDIFHTKSWAGFKSVAFRRNISIFENRRKLRWSYCSPIHGRPSRIKYIRTAYTPKSELQPRSSNSSSRRIHELVGMVEDGRVYIYSISAFARSPARLRYILPHKGVRGWESCIDAREGEAAAGSGGDGKSKNQRRLRAAGDLYIATWSQQSIRIWRLPEESQSEPQQQRCLADKQLPVALVPQSLLSGYIASTLEGFSRSSAVKSESSLRPEDGKLTAGEKDKKGVAALKGDERSRLKQGTRIVGLSKLTIDISDKGQGGGRGGDDEAPTENVDNPDHGDTPRTRALSMVVHTASNVRFHIQVRCDISRAAIFSSSSSSSTSFAIELPPVEDDDDDDEKGVDSADTVGPPRHNIAMGDASGAAAAYAAPTKRAETREAATGDGGGEEEEKNQFQLDKYSSGKKEQATVAIAASAPNASDEDASASPSISKKASPITNHAAAPSIAILSPAINMVKERGQDHKGGNKHANDLLLSKEWFPQTSQPLSVGRSITSSVRGFTLSFHVCPEESYPFVQNSCLLHSVPMWAADGLAKERQHHMPSVWLRATTPPGKMKSLQPKMWSKPTDAIMAAAAATAAATKAGGGGRGGKQEDDDHPTDELIIVSTCHHRKANRPQIWSKCVGEVPRKKWSHVMIGFEANGSVRTCISGKMQKPCSLPSHLYPRFSTQIRFHGVGDFTPPACARLRSVQILPRKLSKEEMKAISASQLDQIRCSELRLSECKQGLRDAAKNPSCVSVVGVSSPYLRQSDEDAKSMFLKHRQRILKCSSSSSSSKAQAQEDSVVWKLEYKNRMIVADKKGRITIKKHVLFKTHANAKIRKGWVFAREGLLAFSDIREHRYTLRFIAIKRQKVLASMYLDAEIENVFTTPSAAIITTVSEVLIQPWMAPGHLIRATLPDKADSVLSADVDIATSRMALLLSSPRKGWRVAVTTIGDHWVTPYIHEHRIEDPIGADLRPREPQILPPPPAKSTTTVVVKSKKDFILERKARKASRNAARQRKDKKSDISRKGMRRNKLGFD